MDYEGIGECQPLPVEKEMLQADALGGYKLRLSREEIGEGYDIGQHHGHAHVAGAQNTGPFVRHLVAAQTQQQEHQQWQCQNKNRNYLSHVVA